MPCLTIVLENAIFTGLSVGILSRSAFRVGTSATDGSDRIIYDDQTGALYFDADGSGTGSSQVQFATLLGSPDLTRFDFFVL
jgi:Ca2+-binding RTX toxin-like protein